MPALSKTPERRSNSAFLPNASRASALASACSITCGGTAVASERRLHDLSDNDRALHSQGGVKRMRAFQRIIAVGGDEPDGHALVRRHFNASIAHEPGGR